MNKILNLKGEFEKRKNSTNSGFQLPRLNKTEVVSSDKLIKIKNELESCKKYYDKDNLINGLIISVMHTRVIAKSKRLSTYFSNSIDKSNKLIVGVKLNDDKSKHVITYFISFDDMINCLIKLDKCIDIIENAYDGKISGEMLDEIIDVDYGVLKQYEISKTQFVNFIYSTFYIDKFFIDEFQKNNYKNSIISFYNVDLNVLSLLSRLNIRKSNLDFLNENTVYLSERELDIVVEKIPYLVAMATSDMAKYTYEKLNTIKTSIEIPKCNNEPIIGVIDTLYSEDTYFNDWVEYHDCISAEIPKKSEDYSHGTAVSSLIVDGPSINPALDDGCGRFRVRHFGVALKSENSLFQILKKITTIIKSNLDIKVWNLSLGSNEEISDNYISIEASILDELQCKYNVIFIVSGTNDNEDTMKKRVGSPADSLNSIVVNAVDYDNNRTSYSRCGPVLSFFIKPDVSCFGGDNINSIRVCDNFGESYTQGTSFAAPWITRKMAYLIEILKLPKEVAKALIIDSATKWESKRDLEFKGYGCVPVHIDDVIKSQNDEIKFYFYQNANEYDSYTTKIPVPCINDGFPYYAKATLVYFPECSRNQGIDYTNTELSLRFGRINGEKIERVANEFNQGIKEFILEEDLRSIYRKWDNVKLIKDMIKDKSRPRIAYEKNKNWGVHITKSNRLSSNKKDNLRFGLVITLKEMKGVNRIGDFIKSCNYAGWIVKEIDAEVYNVIYNKAEEDVVFE